ETYFVVVGNWQPGGPIGGGATSYQVHVEQSQAPANDTCAGAIDVPLGKVVNGTTAGANDDFHSPNNAACFAGIGQTPSDSLGRDVVFSFTAPAAGSYSIRQVPVEVNTATTGQNFTLYASSSCPAAGGTVA